MSLKYKFHNPKGVYFITFAVIEWVDVFTRSEYNEILIQSIKYCQKHKGLEVFSWCIMTNHVHLIAQTKSENSLSTIFRDLKKYTSKAIITSIINNPRESRKSWLLNSFRTSKGYRFWQAQLHPIELTNNYVIDQKINYIHLNPVAQGIVFKAEEYAYSSAIDYAGGKGYIDVTIIN